MTCRDAQAGTRPHDAAQGLSSNFMPVMNVAPAARAARRALLPIALLLASCASQAQSSSADTAPSSPAYLAAQTRWRSELAAFDAADRQQWPGEGGVVFVGSSTIRLWSRLAQ